MPTSAAHSRARWDPPREIFQEGLRIPPVKIFRRGEMNHDVMALLLANVRTPAEREGDLAAQIAACRTGERRLTRDRRKVWRPAKCSTYGQHLLDYSAAMMRAALRELRVGHLHRRRFSRRRRREQTSRSESACASASRRPRRSRFHRFVPAMRR